MGKATSIGWTDSAVNPVAGCPGCELWSGQQRSCYAAMLHQHYPNNPGFSPDFSHPKLFPGRMAEAAGWSDLNGTERPTKPWLNGRPRFVFISDMGDALAELNVIDRNNQPVPGDAVPFDYLKTEIIDTALSPDGRRHVWLWLTKRPERMAQFDQWLGQNYRMDWPLNVWAGTSVTSKKTMWRIGALRETGFDLTTPRFLSLEPLVEEVSLAGHLDGIDWVIAGGESHQQSPARRFECDWARRLRIECAEAGVPFFLKQLGAAATNAGQPLQLQDDHGADWNEWPDDLRVRQVPVGKRDSEFTFARTHKAKGGAQ